MEQSRRCFRIDGPILLLDDHGVANNPEFLKLAGQRIHVSGTVYRHSAIQVVPGERKLSERELRPFIMLAPHATGSEKEPLPAKRE